jgi:23S rRNA pseudouridine1911/1915/1917 synthase
MRMARQGMILTATTSTTVFELMIHGLPDLSRNRLRELLRFGQVFQDGVAVFRANTPVAAGQSIEVRPGRDEATVKRFPANFPILFEDAHLLIADKPPGLLTSDGDPGDPTFLHRVNMYVERNSRGRTHAHLVHRLDREVSGLLVFAKSHEIQAWFKDNWKLHTKRYLALVHGAPRTPSGTLRSWLWEREDQRVVSVPPGTSGAKFAVTHYRTLDTLGDCTLLEVELETGRKNQIRVHLSEAGCPVVGDRRHGADASVNRRVRLHSYQFTLHHPITGVKTVFQTEIPPGFLTLNEKPKPKKLEKALPAPRVKKKTFWKDRAGQ